MSLFPDLRSVAAPPSIDLRCCDVREMLASVRGARLIVADPPWQYNNAGVRGNADSEYGLITDSDIVEILNSSFDSAAPDSRLAVWYTWPKDAEWNAAGGAGPRWGARTTGGAWTKIGTCGVGWHWRGFTEPVALFTRGSPGRCREVLLNGHVSPPSDHSEKPAAWMRQWIEAWTDPGDLVVDVFAGLAPLARACALTGRRYVGAEIDPDRHAMALTRLAAAISRGDL